MRICFCLVGLTATILGMDEPRMVADVRLFGGAAAEGGKITTTTHNDDVDIGTTSFDEVDADMKFRFGVGLYRSVGSLAGLGAPVVGVSFMQTKSDSDGSRTGSGFGDPFGTGIPGPYSVTTNTTVDVTANVYSLHLGWAIAVGRGAHFEFLAHGGYGTLNATEHDLSITNTSTGITEVVDAHSGRDGNYWEVGGSAGLYYTFPSGGQLGLVADAIHGEGDATISRYNVQQGNVVTANQLVNGSFDEKFEIDTVAIYVSLGLRL